MNIRGFNPIIGCVVVIWVLIIVFSGAGWNPLGISWNFSNSGAFGDSFGPISALMASVAAISAIMAYRSQNEEIQRIRIREAEDDKIRRAEDERRLQRESVEDSHARKSLFEGTFFKLLDSFRNIVSETDVGSSDSQKVARDAFKSMVRYMANRTSSGDVNVAWSRTAEYYQNDLNHYFRFLYHIIKFVDESEILEKYFYVRLVRAHLSESEMILIALNCAYGEGREKFSILVEKYALIHNISESAKDRWKLDEVLGAGAFG